ncbi:RNA polymerase sigma-I factor [Cohnella nanjingensis]|uniref:RNA polymerase sigma factor SigI n=1 Tax=Cohnella nanjingensis TaxID=1387779 RepID=A0A7X0VDB4_9BACL|nr:RNA polymerase sigma-I factor [Cohnella nanjingensis]MBB6669790.1 RNA polymerase sigma-I factor [Cohnella nanjingensis]
MLLLLWEKWFGRSSPSVSIDSPGETLEQTVIAAQQGDAQARDDLIRQYQPFIAKTVSRFCKRYIDPSRDDEFSIALSAFDEAIARYSPDAGSRFLGFAEKVIVRRLIDYVRKDQRHRLAVPYSALQGDDEDQGSLLTRVEIREAVTVYEKERLAEDRRDEIAALTEALKLYGVSFGDLAIQSPKHQDSRETLLGIGRRLAANAALFETLRQKRQLPVKELCEAEKVSRKTIERHRKYLIAVALIADGGYPFLRDYIGLSQSGKEGER